MGALKAAATIAVAMSSELINAQRVELGRWVYSSWKHLRGYSAQTTATFEATVLAGKCCDLLGRLRELGTMSMAALTPLARDAGFARTELTSIALPLLDQLGIVQVARVGEKITSVGLSCSRRRT